MRYLANLLATSRFSSLRRDNAAVVFNEAQIVLPAQRREGSWSGALHFYLPWPPNALRGAFSWTSSHQMPALHKALTQFAIPLSYDLRLIMNLMNCLAYHTL